MTTYGYRRVSSEGQEDGASLDQQATKIEAIAMLSELGPVTMFTDVCSGSVPLDERPEGSKLMASLKKGDRVIVAKLDRCFRNASDALSRADWFKAKGIDLYLIDMGNEPVTNNGTSRMFFGMLALMAEFERERIRERTADGRADKKAKGGHIGGKRPFGYRIEGTGRGAVLVAIPEEQAQIELIKELDAAGESLRSIAAKVQANGFELSHMGVKKVLNRT